MAVKGLVAAIIQFLTQQLEDGDIIEDSRESLEVAIQCLESTYNVQASNAPANFNLYEVYKSIVGSTETPPLAPEATPAAKVEAEKLKNDGNTLMKSENYYEALASYTKAIQLDGRNAVYYCNRAAAYSKIGNHLEAIKDCRTALTIDPSYSKAYGRLGLAYSSLEKHKEAKESYQKALEMEPDNESYKNNLQVAEEKFAQQCMSNLVLDGDMLQGIDVYATLRNPAFRNVARQIVHDPTLRGIMSNFISENMEQGTSVQALFEASNQVAQQMRNVNPELIEFMRRQLLGNPSDPEPPQEN